MLNVLEEKKSFLRITQTILSWKKMKPTNYHSMIIARVFKMNFWSLQETWWKNLSSQNFSDNQDSLAVFIFAQDSIVYFPH